LDVYVQFLRVKNCRDVGIVMRIITNFIDGIICCIKLEKEDIFNGWDEGLGNYDDPFFLTGEPTEEEKEKIIPDFIKWRMNQ